MRRNTTLNWLLMLLLFASTVLAVLNGVDIASAFVNRGADAGDGNPRLKAFKLVDEALKVRIPAAGITFDGSVANPFRTLSTVEKRVAGKAPVAQEPYRKLYLQGTLIKDDALAILVDDEGKTYICKKGDRVHNRLISEISVDRVIITNGGKPEVLTVREH